MPSLADLLERDCVIQMQSTIPPAMTIAEWRRTRPGPRTEVRHRSRRLRVPGWAR